MRLLSRFEVRVFLTAFVVLWIFGAITVACGDRYDGPSKRCETYAVSDTAGNAVFADISENSLMTLHDDFTTDGLKLNKPEDDLGNGFGPCNSTPLTDATPMTTER